MNLSKKAKLQVRVLMRGQVQPTYQALYTAKELQLQVVIYIRQVELALP